MHYVKHFDINGVDTKQVACIELPSKPNAATEGSVGLLGIDMSSPTHDVYKCVAVNGSIYTWELLSSGLSTIAATISGGGEEVVQFPYSNLKIPSGYVVKKGDLIIDSDCYLYQVDAIDVGVCRATYCDVAFTKGVPGNDGQDGLTPYIGENGHWWIGNIDTGVVAPAEFRYEAGSYVGTGTYGKENPNIVTADFEPQVMIFFGHYPGAYSGTRSYEVGICYWNLLESKHISFGVRDDWSSGEDELGVLTPHIWDLSADPTFGGVKAEVVGNSVSWYAKDAGLQANVSGITYDYIILG